MGLLDGKVAIVTGGSGGLGSETVRVFLREGATVHYTGLNQGELDAVQPTFSDKAIGHILNVAKEEDCRNFIKAVVAKSGKIDILINNAGITKDALFTRMTTDDWNAVININLNSIFHLTHEAFPHMKENAEGGSIINISSIVGRQGNLGQANYAAAKAGLIGFSRSIAREGARRKIRCNAVCPGFIDTPMTAVIPEKVKAGLVAQIPMQEMGLPKDIANACLYLASDMGRYVTGVALDVNGGMFMG
ncbi:3-oxoacyl-ACP reductase FabG [Entomospira culicis]|uniref:3-oxoacyl-ACP reductase FabG n=1 Tax=Entomospira culicis TaxID=2719989 RepID=A0A968GJF8_9SPIO|nr:3-oxoacyl-ACP reductase FabG [Entomospira culicis]NIZ19300.1 3-oxoacyl-ACP reductase FabG [Entomospira culicis]NIZ69795.1 3-oxoacyl-ACP reductase FabG [Entomospira culicis]WDI36904.1 3-oxoacyl-ACP reductase FabG [Entomospira culicis]WDI38533.1 3-oxoacyl-ACP reductase FabG [Entomospira culicis]